MSERKTQKKLRFLVKGYDEGWLRYEPRSKKEIDFAKYTIAQINEVNNVLILIRRIVDSAYLSIPEMYETGFLNQHAIKQRRC
jgi:non-ribosomal peptide synthetase component E (peptide arylation enzyme)